MSSLAIDNASQLFHKKGLFLVFSAIIFCVGLSISYPLGILPLEGIYLLLVLPFLLLFFSIRPEAILLALVAAYFGAGYFFPELLTQSLIRSALLFLVGFMLILRSGAKQVISRVSTPLDKMIFLWLAVIFMSFFYGLYRGNETGYLMGDLYKFVEIISVFWFATFIIRTRKNIRFLIWGFLVAVLIFSAIDLTIFFTRVSLIGGVLGARVRAGAQFSSVFAIILVVTLILHEKKIGTRIILTFLGFIFFFSFVISFSRTGYIVLPIALIIVLSLYFHKNKVRSLRGVMSFIFLLVFLLIFLALFGMIIMSINPDINLVEATFARLGTLIEPTAAGSPWGVRMLEIRSIISTLVQSPLLGNGLGGEYYSASGFTGQFKWGMKHYVHNNYFDFLIRTGILGLFVFLLIAFKYSRDTVMFYLKSKDSFYEGALLGFIGIFIALSITALSCSILYSPFLFLIMAMTYCVASRERQKSLETKEG